MERVKVWQDFENSRISLSEARSKSRALEEGLQDRVKKKFNELQKIIWRNFEQKCKKHDQKI